MRRASRRLAARPVAGGLVLEILVALVLVPSGACVSPRAAARFPPASDVQARAALDAWSSIRRRAGALPPTRLLYDARMSGKGVPAMPGTLAVTYDGADVTRASLTGPFGKPVAEYADGVVTRGAEQPFPVDPRVLGSVLAATWPSDAARVEGCDAGGCLLVFDGPVRAEAVVDSGRSLLVSLRVTGEAGVLSAEYGWDPPAGTTAAPGWPPSVSVEQQGGSRRIALKLVAAEPAGGGGAGS